ncbi:hypothetical protein [Tateyamaria sp. Alg231-49]|uniref:hypothetical protein n=1 Tax=Tateyamaria sp. Alg231-49 TaxID=1922219 RepID=UPI00131F2BAE|nr:hypothetical protein [Tateyamaria sp. Alg231-49]
MEFTLDELIDLLAGRRGDLQVGVIPLEVRQHFGCSREEVFLSSESARHIIDEHGDHIGKNELLRIPEILTKGMWVADRKLACSVSFQTETPAIRLLAAIKITRNHSRMYVSTLHRAKKRQTKSKLKRGQLLRPHWT